MINVDLIYGKSRSMKLKSETVRLQSTLQPPHNSTSTKHKGQPYIPAPQAVWSSNKYTGLVETLGLSPLWLGHTGSHPANWVSQLMFILNFVSFIFFYRSQC